MGSSSNDLTLRLGFDVNKFAGDLKKGQAQISSFTKNISGIAGALTAAFSVKAVADFGLAISKLSGEAQGVKEAFDKLPGSVNLMHDLKNATHGTVSELELMKRSVMASNFDIALKELPKLLEFATLRAKQTGQSVDYLVDSIVTGIGRKSKLILDNLGISAVALTEALGGASAASSSIAEVTEAVGKIIDRNMDSMGRLSENAATKIDRLNAAWVNMKIHLGDVANGTGALGRVTEMATKLLEVYADKNVGFWDKVKATFSGQKTSDLLVDKALRESKAMTDEVKAQADAIQTARYFLKQFAGDYDKVKEAVKGAKDEIHVLNALNQIKLETEKKSAESIRNEKNLTEQLNNLRDEATLAVGREREALNKKILAIEAEIDALRKLGVEQKKVAKSADAVTLGPPPELISPDVWASPDKGTSSDVSSGPAFDEEGFQDKLDKMERMRAIAMRVASEFGQMFGEVISGAKSMSEAMGDMAESVIQSLIRMLPSLLPGPLGVFASLGLGALGGILGRRNSQKGPQTSNFGGLGNSAFDKSMRNYQGMHLVAQVTGRQLNFVMKNQSTWDSSVKTT